MSEITIGIKTVISIVSGTVGLVSAYWFARRAAAKDTLDLERKFNKLKMQVVAVESTSQDRDDVKVLVRDSLDNLSAILTAIQQTADTNSDELMEVRIQQGILSEKVRALEEHYREHGRN